ncbi:MAG: TIGR02206 family membrane protein [Candidatus Marinimicrobia bacterium]|nr:TIGR02206 family membrane protein [Candidatus Neomarinimicrobiota bacterium]
MPAENFILFGKSHLLTLVLLTFIGFFIIRKLEQLSPPLSVQRWHPRFGFLALLNGVIWRMLLVEIGDFHPEQDLPFHVCSLSTFLLAIYFWFPRQKLFDVLFYWIMTGSVLGFFIPDLEMPFPHVRFFAMFISHGLLIFFMVYLYRVQGLRPSPTGYQTAFGVLTTYALGFVLPFNLLSGGNYLFALEPPDVDFVLVQFLPPWPWYIPVLLGFFYLAFYSLHRAIFRQDRRYQQEHRHAKSETIHH